MRWRIIHIGEARSPTVTARNSPKKSGCRGLELKGYELGPGVHQTFGHMDDSVKASGSIHSVTDQFRSVRSGWPVGPIQEHHEFPAVPSIGHDASPRS